MISPIINRISCIIFLLFFIVQVEAQSFYSLPAKDVTGEEFGIEKYKDKKLLIIIVSLDNPDSLINAINKFKSKYRNEIEVIGLMVEDNYSDSSTARKMIVYNKMKSSLITLAEGGSRNPLTNPLLRWLSDRNNSHAFSKDVTAAGSKFFIGEQGSVINVLSPQIPLDAPIIDFIVNTAPQKKGH